MKVLTEKQKKFIAYLKKNDSQKYQCFFNKDTKVMTLKYKDKSELNVGPDLESQQPEGIAPFSRGTYHRLVTFKKFELLDNFILRDIDDKNYLVTNLTTWKDLVLKKKGNLPEQERAKTLMTEARARKGTMRVMNEDGSFNLIDYMPVFTLDRTDEGTMTLAEWAKKTDKHDRLFYV